MGKKNKKKNVAASPEPTPDTEAISSGSATSYIAIALLVLGAGVFVFALSSGPQAPASPIGDAASVVGDASHDGHAHAERDPGQSRQWRYFEDPAEAHPLPVTLPPSQFTNTGIAHTYEIAKEIPEVLAQQPCLCGCDNTSDDHRSLLDCFIDEHASTCMVCMKEAVYAEQMTEAGESVAWIREQILEGAFSDINIGN